jgi:hypothetical protein
MDLLKKRPYFLILFNAIKIILPLCSGNFEKYYRLFLSKGPGSGFTIGISVGLMTSLKPTILQDTKNTLPRFTKNTLNQ